MNDLLMRLYYREHMHGVARAVGYAGQWQEALQELLAPLRARHGSLVDSALIELTNTDDEGFVTLKPRVRPLCYQLLGPPPERWDEWYTHPDGSPMKRPPGKERPPERPPRPGPKRRSRRKTG